MLKRRAHAHKNWTFADIAQSQIKVETNILKFGKGSEETHVTPAASHLHVFPLICFPHCASVSVSFLIGRESCFIPLLSSGNMLLRCQKVRQSRLCLTVLVSADMLSLKMSFGLHIINQQKGQIKDWTQWDTCNRSRMSHYSDCNTVFKDLLWHHVTSFPGSLPKPQTTPHKKPKKKHPPTHTKKKRKKKTPQSKTTARHRTVVRCLAPTAGRSWGVFADDNPR